MLSDSFLSELTYKCDIEQIVGGYVNLKRRGRILTGLCPFHSEKTPSFTVYPETQSFYCFGCGAGGSVITFIQKIENLDYIEAVRFLADKAGLAMPEDEDVQGGRELRLKILEMNRTAARFFHGKLLSDEGKAARLYLTARGMNKAMVIKFGIGYAPDSWYELLNFLKSKGFTEEEMRTAGLVGKSQKGNYFDTFRNRVIFPIIDLRGSVIGFGGRRLGEDGPKYLNSSDTPAFKKSRNLFAMNFAKAKKRPELILCEGYMDVVSMYDAGLDNAVATLGTALTDEQARLIAGYTSEVILSYDSDGAGQAATARATAILDKVGIKSRVLTIDGAKDPDEYIKKYGAEKFISLVEKSVGVTDYEINKLHSQFDIDTPEGKIAFLDGFVKLMANTPNEIEREVYVSKVAREAEIDRTVLLSRIDAILKKRHRAAVKKDARDLRSFAFQSPLTKGDFEKQKYPRESLAIERLIAFLYKNPDKIEIADGAFPTENIPSAYNREIFTAMIGRIKEGLTVDMLWLGSVLSENAMSRMSEILAAETTSFISEEEARECVETLKKREKTAVEVAQLGDEDLKKYIASLSKSKK